MSFFFFFSAFQQSLHGYIVQGCLLISALRISRSIRPNVCIEK